MSDIAISVEKLGKSYMVGHNAAKVERYTALRDVIARYARGLARKTNDLIHGRPIIPGDDVEEFWALRDLSFTLRRGETLGIIGANGAGKSTLLKILSRVTEPSCGRVTINGRVASLLEVGTGFHPELTGRENIFLNGAILGMSRKEIHTQFDAIVDFAEIEQFLDTPVKRYSSGMYVRLAFAVAAHLQPEVLIVDEVLAVGDAQFQKKCLGKMQDVSAEGRTVLFVSHNLAAVELLTQKTLLLQNGRLHFFGPTSAAITKYLECDNHGAQTRYVVEHARRKFSGNGAARILELRFERPTPYFGFGEDVSFVARVRSLTGVRGVRFSITIYSTTGTPVGSCFGAAFCEMLAGDDKEFEVSVPAPPLAPGAYCCGVAVGKGDHVSGYVNFDVVHDVLFFEVRPDVSSEGTLMSWGQTWGSIVLPALQQRRIAT
jgi:lipopolysaccharide transport system ATP-binding protein